MYIKTPRNDECLCMHKLSFTRNYTYSDPMG